MSQLTLVRPLEPMVVCINQGWLRRSGQLLEDGHTPVFNKDGRVTNLHLVQRPLRPILGPVDDHDASRRVSTYAVRSTLGSFDAKMSSWYDTVDGKLGLQLRMDISVEPLDTWRPENDLMGQFMGRLRLVTPDGHKLALTHRPKSRLYRCIHMIPGEVSGPRLRLRMALA